MPPGFHLGGGGCRGSFAPQTAQLPPQSITLYKLKCSTSPKTLLNYSCYNLFSTLYKSTPPSTSPPSKTSWMKCITNNPQATSVPLSMVTIIDSSLYKQVTSVECCSTATQHGPKSDNNLYKQATSVQQPLSMVPKGDNYRW